MKMHMCCGVLVVVMLAGCGRRAAEVGQDYGETIQMLEARVQKLESDNVDLRDEVKELRARLGIQLRDQIREALDGMVDAAVRERMETAGAAQQARGRGMRGDPATMPGMEALSEEEAAARRVEWEARRQEMQRRAEERMVDGILGDLNLNEGQRESMIAINQQTAQTARDRFMQMRDAGTMDRDMAEAILVEIQAEHLEAAAKVLDAEQMTAYRERQERIMSVMNMMTRGAQRQQDREQPQER